MNEALVACQCLGFDENRHHLLSASLNRKSVHQLKITLRHLLSFRPAADLQSLTFADGHLESERDPDVSQILRPRVEGEALHAAHLLPTARK